ncbi:MAG: hypothetical protein ACM3PF_06140 [Bacteroidota bacterium]
MSDPEIKKEIAAPVAARGLRETQVSEWHTEDLDFDEDARLIIKNPKLGARLRDTFRDGDQRLHIVLENLPDGSSVLRPMSVGTGDPGGTVRSVNPTNMMCPCEPVKP